jgi:hypothetical protein
MLSVIAIAEALALALLSYITTWPTKEIPHNNAADCCLASPRMNYVLGSDLGEAPLATGTIPSSGKTCPALARGSRLDCTGVPLLINLLVELWSIFLNLTKK